MAKAFTDNEKNYIRTALKQAAMESLKDLGLRRTTVDDLVKKVNIPKGTFYLFYKSKEELMFEAIEEVHDQIQKEMTEALGQLKGNVTVDNLTEIFMNCIDLVDDSGLAVIMNSGDFEWIMRKLSDETMERHFKKDNVALENMVRLIPGLSERLDEDSLKALEGAFRALFLNLLYKREMGEENFRDSMFYLTRGLVIQMFHI